MSYSICQEMMVGAVVFLCFSKRERYGEPFEIDAKVDFNNNRRGCLADSNYGS